MLAEAVFWYFCAQQLLMFELDKKITNELKRYIASAERVVIVSHTNPDGDAIGSSLAFGRYLEKTGKNVSIMMPNHYPEFLAWMPGNREILIWEKDEDRCRALVNDADLVFCLDFNALHRLDGLGVAVSRADNPKILIDHHIEPADEFALKFSDIRFSSTSEMIYKLIVALGGADRIDPDVAVNLFVGIMTDTGSFSYACKHADVFNIIADLVSRGVDPEKTHRLVYDTYSENRMRLLGHSLSERMKVIPEFHTAYIYLTAKDLEKFNFKIGDTEGLVNYPLSINGVNFSVLFTEKEGHIRMSFRSKGEFSVNTFVREHFEGGGHRNAAGGNSYEEMQETLKRFESLLPMYKEQLQKAGN